MTLDGLKPIANGGANGFEGHDGANDEDDDDTTTLGDPNAQLEMENRAAPVMEASFMNGHSHPYPTDVEMS